jgi:class 3 adenylate cyclase/streptogramin lyase
VTVSDQVDRVGRVVDLPKGTVTFLLTDIESSTRHWQDDPAAMKLAIERHDQLLANGIEEHAGIVLKERGEGDSFFAVFARASDAVAATCSMQRALYDEHWPGRLAIRVRMAIHTGEAHEESATDYRGSAVNRCARLRALASGGQVLVSSSVRELARDSLPDGITLKDLGEHQLRDLDRPEHVFQVVDPALPVAPSSVRRPLIDRRRWPLIAGTSAAVVVVAAASLVAASIFGGSQVTSVTPAIDQVAAVAPDGHSFTRAITVGGQRPEGVVDSGDYLWVINYTSQTLTRINKATGASQTFGVGGAPTGIALGGGSVWVTTEFGLTGGEPGSVVRFDASDGHQLPPLNAGDGVAGIAAGQHEIWVTNEKNDTLVRIDADTGAIGNPIHVGRGPKAVALGAGSVWVANSLDRTVSRVDPRTGVVSPPILVQAADAIAADNSGAWVVGTATNSVTHVDAVTNGIKTTISVPSGPTAIALTANAVWVAADVAGEVVEIDPSTGQIVQRLKVNGHPSAIATHGASVWVTISD